MKKVIESMHLNEWLKMMRRWFRRNDRDDDLFNHPFAIF
jgi:hypothetical protein